MALLEVSTGIASGLLRFAAYCFLTFFPGSLLWKMAYLCFGFYFLAWLYNDFNLKSIETLPRGVMQRQADKASHEAAHAGHLQASEPKAPANQSDAPSYAAITSEKKHPKQNKSVNTAVEPTQGIPMASHPSVAANNVPARPGFVSLFSGSLTSSRVFNRVSIIVNVLLVLACLDLQFAPHFFYPENDLAFVRVGAVTPSAATLVARVPPLHELEAAEYGWDAELQAKVVDHPSAQVLYRLTQPLGDWQKGPLLASSNESDWMVKAELSDLYASTQYEIRLTLPGRAAIHPSFPKTIRFTTWADPKLSTQAGTHYKFASSSCMLPGWPYRIPGSWTDRLRMKGVDHLADGIRKRGIEWLLFVGDFIYADVPGPFFKEKQDYLQKYRQVYASPSYRRIYESIPTLHMYDDHELQNDYTPLDNASVAQFEVAESAWELYQGAGNYKTQPLTAQSPANYYWFQNGDSAFFVWDTRSYRSDNFAPDDANKTMLGSLQKQVYLEWLQSVNQTVTWKFVVSSVPFTSMWDSGHASAADTWATFLHERSELMDVMEYVPNIIVLSGDRHEAAAVLLRNSVLEISTSPLHQFYLPIRTLSQAHGAGATGEEELLKYLPDGNSKYTTFEVDTRTKNRPTVRVETWIDGEKAWHTTVLGQVVHQPPIALGGLAPTLAQLLGFLRRRWF